jgi:serine protease Do
VPHSWFHVAAQRLIAVAIAVAVTAAYAAPCAAQSRSTLGDLSDSFEDVAARVTPAVVQVFATGYTAGPGLIAKQRGSGSGVVVDADGYIVTNAHVVEGARRVRVLIPLSPDAASAQRSILKTPGREVGGQIVGIDRETDLAVIKVPVKGLASLPLGDSDAVAQGQVVLAFGSPFGLENSVSMGIVSSVARQLRPEDPLIYIQTDATINPGNSGGPLVNAEGDVVGINAMIFSQSGGSEGIGFAIPANIVSDVYQQIRATGRVRRGEIGVHAQTITPTLARGLGIEQNSGVIIGDVFPGGPAARAGLQVGDVVVALDGKPMENGRQLDVNVYRESVGAEVTIEYLRGGTKGAARVTVVERPDDPQRFEELVSPEENLVPRLGILAVDMSPRIASMLPPQRRSTGVVVAAQSPDGPAWQDGFRPGDVIHAVNGRTVTDLDDLRAAVAALGPGDAVAVQLQRGTRLQFLAFEME